MNFDQLIIGHITLGMVVAFLLGNMCLFLYIWSAKVRNKNPMHGSKLMRSNWTNIAFHFVSSTLVLFVLHEVGEVLLSAFAPELEYSKGYHMTMAGLTGMFGSVLITYLIEKVTKTGN